MARGELARNPAALYGMYAADSLVNELMKLGSKRAALKAKVFGGSSLLAFPGSIMNRIAEGNVNFAFEYLRSEGIPVLARDVGGNWARRIWLFPDSGRVLLRRWRALLDLPLAYRESRYRIAARQKAEGSELRLFADGHGSMPGRK